MKAEIFAVLLLFTVAMAFLAHTTKVLDHDWSIPLINTIAPVYLTVLVALWGVFICVIGVIVYKWIQKSRYV